MGAAIGGAVGGVVGLAAIAGSIFAVAKWLRRSVDGWAIVRIVQRLFFRPKAPGKNSVKCTSPSNDNAVTFSIDAHFSHAVCIFRSSRTFHRHRTHRTLRRNLTKRLHHHQLHRNNSSLTIAFITFMSFVRIPLRFCNNFSSTHFLFSSLRLTHVPYRK